MADPLLTDRMFQHIMRGLVDRGVAPHYAEFARALGLSVEEGRRLLLDVMHAYPIGWLHPETHYIASFPPLNSQPTQYRDLEAATLCVSDGEAADDRGAARQPGCSSRRPMACTAW